VAPMMYGFGDENPAADTVSVMEELLIEHITDIVSYPAPPSRLRAVLTLFRAESALKLNASRRIEARSKWRTSSSHYGKTRRSSRVSRSCCS
jgi:hypothetical protein